MFKRLRNLLHFPALRANQRAIFRYWDGVRNVACDPVAAMIAIETDPEFRLDQHPQQVDEGNGEAAQITCRMVGRVFNLSDFDPATGKGLTVAERLALFSAFGEYVEALKKNGEPFLTPPPATDAVLSS